MANTENTKAFYNVRIPSDWEVSKFGTVCEKLLDGTHFSPKSKEGPFKYITSKNIRNEGLDMENMSYVSETEHFEIYKRCPVQYGDILLTKDGAGTGACCINTLKEEFSLLSSVAVLRTRSSKMINEYLLHFIKSPLGQKIIQDAISGQAITRITLEKIRAFKVTAPPLPEQRAIAQVLSLMDSTIHTNNQLIAQKELRKKWLMQELLTGKKRLRGFEGVWKETKLVKLFNQIKNVNDGEEIHSIMTISSKLGLISQEDKFDRVIAGDSLKKYTQLEKEDFAYNKGNSKTYPMGCIYQLEDKESALVPFVYICFSPSELVDAKFYKHWFLAHGLDRQLNKIITSGARGDGLLNVNTDDFFKLNVPFPPKEEQTAIAQVLQTADKEIQLLKAKTERLKEQKKGMMQVLLTGKKRLKIETN